MSSASYLDKHDSFVIGGGITGITTALALQAVGMKPAILTRQISTQGTGENAVPSVPTGYAMASAYPHNLRVDNLQEISTISQMVLQSLQGIPESGISTYRMFELFEQEPPLPPALGDARMRLKHVCGKPADLKRTIDAPVRNAADYVWGWTFESYFADMPVYLPFLWKTFKANGGAVEHMSVELENVLNLASTRPIFNCCGWGAVALMKDPSPRVVMRGKQVLVPGAPKLTTSDGMSVAYNYTPTADIFPLADGTAEYVHFFARSDGWILGQTREPGELDDEGNWHGSSVATAQHAVKNCSVPAPILDLNAEILANWRGCSLPDTNRMIGREGYRYYRDPDGEGVRLDLENIDGCPVFHNYGHGGSGVTMSWGCAIKCVQNYSQGINEARKIDSERECELITRLLRSVSIS